MKNNLYHVSQRSEDVYDVYYRFSQFVRILSTLNEDFFYKIFMKIHSDVYKQHYCVQSNSLRLFTTF